MGWGLLGPEHAAGARRTRTLGLGAAVRTFNHLAVPGLGGVWFAKQIFLSTLGVRLADRLRPSRANIRAIEIANAVEALACWCAFNGNGWTSDPRLRGRQKLAGKNDLTFERLSQPQFYVTQPMRMATVEALVDFGFVETTNQRFNSFRCSRSGLDLIDAATSEYRPFNRSVEDELCKRAEDNACIGDSSTLQAALSPLIALNPDARMFIREKLCGGSILYPMEALRRKSALAWVRSIDAKNPARWDRKPSVLGEDHWRDLKSGARFFAARDAAIGVLNAIEMQMAPLAAPKISADDVHKSSSVRRQLEVLRKVAQRFLDLNADPTEARTATAFCRECVEVEPAATIRHLVKRDDRVLRMIGNDVLPGISFSYKPQAEPSDESVEGVGVDNARRVPVPVHISGRIRNLYLLELDLQGRLSEFLAASSQSEAA